MSVPTKWIRLSHWLFYSLLVQLSYVSSSSISEASETDRLLVGGPVNTGTLEGQWYEYYRSSTGLTWSEAQAFAASRSMCGQPGNLVKISSEDENQFVADLVNDDDTAWIGLEHTSLPGVSSILEPKDFLWVVKRRRVEYHNFEVGQPSLTRNDDACVATTNGLWDDITCDTPLSAFVIEFTCKAPNDIDWQIRVPGTLSSEDIIDIEMSPERAHNEIRIQLEAPDPDYSPPDYPDEAVGLELSKHFFDCRTPTNDVDALLLKHSYQTESRILTVEVDMVLSLLDTLPPEIFDGDTFQICLEIQYTFLRIPVSHLFTKVKFNLVASENFAVFDGVSLETLTDLEESGGEVKTSYLSPAFECDPLTCSAIVQGGGPYAQGEKFSLCIRTTTKAVTVKAITDLTLEQGLQGSQGYIQLENALDDIFTFVDCNGNDSCCSITIILAQHWFIESPPDDLVVRGQAEVAFPSSDRRSLRQNYRSLTLQSEDGISYEATGFDTHVSLTSQVNVRSAASYPLHKPNVKSLFRSWQMSMVSAVATVALHSVILSLIC